MYGTFLSHHTNVLGNVFWHDHHQIKHGQFILVLRSDSSSCNGGVVGIVSVVAVAAAAGGGGGGVVGG